MKIIMLGPQASGKGTQAKLLAEKLKIAHISTGEIFRAMTRETALGKKVRDLIDNGNLVPNDITNEVVKERLLKEDCKKGFILDGYPRNMNQALALDKIAKLDKVIYLDINIKETLRRISGRRECTKCKAIFNIYTNKPKKEGICDNCNNKLYQRDDDKEEAVKKRLEIYHNETTPLINFYEKKGILLRINGEQTIDAIAKDVYKKISG